MKSTRNNLDTSAGPSDCFTGSVYIDTIAASIVSRCTRASSRRA
jgi:hypothetical protein